MVITFWLLLFGARELLMKQHRQLPPETENQNLAKYNKI